MSRGRPRSITDERLIDVVKKSESPVATAAQVARELDVTTQAARKRLEELARSGAVEREKVDGRTIVWWADVG